MESAKNENIELRDRIAKLTELKFGSISRRKFYIKKTENVIQNQLKLENIDRRENFNEGAFKKHVADNSVNIEEKKLIIVKKTEQNTQKGLIIGHNTKLVVIKTENNNSKGFQRK